MNFFRNMDSSSARVPMCWYIGTSYNVYECILFRTALKIFVCLFVCFPWKRRSVSVWTSWGFNGWIMLKSLQSTFREEVVADAFIMVLVSVWINLCGRRSFSSARKVGGLGAIGRGPKPLTNLSYARKGTPATQAIRIMRAILWVYNKIGVIHSSLTGMKCSAWEGDFIVPKKHQQQHITGYSIKCNSLPLHDSVKRDKITIWFSGQSSSGGFRIYNSSMTSKELK